MNVVNNHKGVVRARVDLSDNSTTVYTGKAILIGLHCANDISAQDVLINDDTTLVAGVAASSPAGTSIDLFNMPITTSIVVDPDDAATGILMVMYQPNHDGDAGDGAN